MLLVISGYQLPPPFGSKRDLSTRTVIQSNENKFKCKISEKPFSFKKAFTRHKIIHSGGRNFKCEICGKSFGQKGNLLSRKLLHSREKNSNVTFVENLSAMEVI